MPNLPDGYSVKRLPEGYKVKESGRYREPVGFLDTFGAMATGESEGLEQQAKGGLTALGMVAPPLAAGSVPMLASGAGAAALGGASAWASGGGPGSVLLGMMLPPGLQRAAKLLSLLRGAKGAAGPAVAAAERAVAPEIAAAVPSRMSSSGGALLDPSLATIAPKLGVSSAARAVAEEAAVLGPVKPAETLATAAAKVARKPRAAAAPKAPASDMEGNLAASLKPAAEATRKDVAVQMVKVYNGADAVTRKAIIEAYPGGKKAFEELAREAGLTLTAAQQGATKTQLAARAARFGLEE